MRRYAIWAVVGAIGLGVGWWLWRGTAPPPSAKMWSTPAGALGSAPSPEISARMMSPAEVEAQGGDVTLAAIEQTLTRRYLIRNASLTLEVEEPREALDQITRLITEHQGYVADLQEWTDELGNRSAAITFRVPAERFEQVLAAVQSLGKVFNLRVSAEDVTEQYIDVGAQLRNLKRTEERLLGHLSRTARLADTLAVERELSRVRQQIEQLEGRIRFLQNRVTYCTVNVSLQQRARAQPISPPETYSTAKVATDAVRAVIALALKLWTVVVWVAVWSVVWLPLAFLVWFVYRRSIVRKGASPTADGQTPP